MKRVGIFVFFDREGIVDRYIEYLLQKMNQVLERLIILCNGEVSEQGMSVLRTFSKEVYIRDNIGFDAGAYKYLLLEKGLLEEFQEYDELVLFNDTCYGPVYPIQNVFRDMQDRQVDFWGMTQYKDQFVKKHLQSYFMVFNNKVILSNAFLEFWENCNTDTTVVGSLINEFEIQMTSFLSDVGFTWDSYISPEKYENLNPYFYFSDQMIIEDKFPFLKKRRFKYKTLNQSTDRDLIQAMKYIDEQTSYPIQLIYENAIRVNNVFDLRENLNLNYVISDIKILDESREFRAAVFMDLNDQKFLFRAQQYITNIPVEMDIYVSTNNDVIMKDMEKCLSARNNRYRLEQTVDMMNNLKQYASSYEYLCFVHDNKDGKGIQAEDSRYVMWNNLFKSVDYVKNIMNTLKSNPYLGLLSTPYLYHGNNISVFADEAQGEQKIAVGLMKQLGLKNRIQFGRKTITGSASFWCKFKAVRQLIEQIDLVVTEKSNMSQDGWTNHELNMFALLLPYVAQGNGYLSGQVENPEFAAMTLINYENLLRNSLSNGQIMEHCKLTNENTPQKSVESFYEENQDKKVYIYGIGLFGNTILNLLKGKVLAGFIVSDEYFRETRFKDLDIYKLSQIREDGNTAIIVAMDRKNTEDVKNVLSRFNEVLYIW